MEACRDSTALRAALAALQGEAGESGTFTIDVERARAQLRRYQLADPDRFVVLLVRGLILRGATQIHVQFGARTLALWGNAPPLSRSTLGSLFSALVSAPTTGRGAATRWIALGLENALAGDPAECVIECGDESGVGSRLRVRPAAREQVEPAVRVRPGVTIRVVDRVGVGLLANFAQRLVGGGTARAVVERAFRHAARPIVCDGEDVARGLGGAFFVPSEAEDEGSAPQWLTAHAVGSRAAIACVQVDGAAIAFAPTLQRGPSAIDWVLDEVLVTTRVEPEIIPGLRMAVSSTHLRPTLGLDDLVADDAYETLVAQIGAAVEAPLSAYGHAAFGQGAAAPAVRAWMRALWTWSVLEGAGSLARAWATIPMFETGQGVAVAAQELGGRDEIAWLTAIPPEIPSQLLNDVVILEDEAQARALSSWTDRPVTEARVQLAAARRRLERWQRWQARPHAPRLGDERTLERVEIDEGDVIGEVGVRGVDDVLTRVRWIVEGKHYADASIRLPGVGVLACIAGPLTPDAELVDVERDQAFLTALGAIAAAALRAWEPICARAAARPPTTAFVDAVTRVVLCAKSRAAWIEALHACGCPAELAQALDERVLSRLSLGLEHDVTHSLARIPCIPTLGGTRVSLRDLATVVARGGALHAMDPSLSSGASEPAIGASSTVSQAATDLDAGGSERLILLLSRENADALAAWWSHLHIHDHADEFRRREARRAFRAQPLRRVEPETALGPEAAVGAIARADCVALAVGRAPDDDPTPGEDGLPEGHRVPDSKARVFVLDAEGGRLAWSDETALADALERGRVRGRRISDVTLPGWLVDVDVAVGLLAPVLDETCTRVVDEDKVVAASVDAVLAMIEAELHDPARLRGDEARHTRVLARLRPWTRHPALIAAAISLRERPPSEAGLAEVERLLILEEEAPDQFGPTLAAMQRRGEVPRAHRLRALLGLSERPIEAADPARRRFRAGAMRCWSAWLSTESFVDVEGRAWSIDALRSHVKNVDRIAVSEGSPRRTRARTDVPILVLGIEFSRALAAALGVDQLLDGDALIEADRRAQWLARRPDAPAIDEVVAQALCSVSVAGPGARGALLLPVARARPGEVGRVTLQHAGKSVGDLAYESWLGVFAAIDIAQLNLDDDETLDPRTLAAIEGVLAGRIPALLSALEGAWRTGEPRRREHAETWIARALSGVPAQARTALVAADDAAATSQPWLWALAEVPLWMLRDGSRCSTMRAWRAMRDDRVFGYRRATSEGPQAPARASIWALGHLLDLAEHVFPGAMPDHLVDPSAVLVDLGPSPLEAAEPSRAASPSSADRSVDAAAPGDQSPPRASEAKAATFEVDDAERTSPQTPAGSDRSDPQAIQTGDRDPPLDILPTGSHLSARAQLDREAKAWAQRLLAGPRPPRDPGPRTRVWLTRWLTLLDREIAAQGVSLWPVADVVLEDAPYCAPMRMIDGRLHIHIGHPWAALANADTGQPLVWTAFGAAAVVDLRARTPGASIEAHAHWVDGSLRALAATMTALCATRSKAPRTASS